MRPARSFAVLLAVTLVGLPTNALATISLRASYSYGGVARAQPNLNEFFQGSLTDVKVDDAGPAKVEPPDINKTAFGHQGYASANGNVFAEAEFASVKAGVAMNLKANNFESAAAGTNTARVDLTGASATASWRDSLELDSPDVPTGVEFKVTGFVQIGGELSAAATADGCCARAEARVNVTDFSGFELPNSGIDEQTFPAQATDGTRLPAGKMKVIIPFVNGLKRDLGYGLTVTVRGYANRGHITIGYPLSILPGNSTANMLSSYKHTLTWGGIESVVVAATGQPVENWTITAESGFDYSRPYEVPEPASLLPFGLALCCSIGLRARR